MTAATWKIGIEQGASYTLGIKILDDAGMPVDPTGYTAHMQVRAVVGAPGPPLVDLSTGNGGITIDTVAKRFVIGIPAADTAAYTWTHGVYDLLITAPDGTVDRLLRGPAEVSAGVTTG